MLVLDEALEIVLSSAHSLGAERVNIANVTKFEICEKRIVADNQETIANELKCFSDEAEVDVVYVRQNGKPVKGKFGKEV